MLKMLWQEYDNFLLVLFHGIKMANIKALTEGCSPLTLAQMQKLPINRNLIKKSIKRKVLEDFPFLFLHGVKKIEKIASKIMRKKIS